MADLPDWVIKSILIGVFIISIVTFGVSIGSNYGKTATEMSGNAVDLSRIEASINSTNVQAEAWKSAFESDSPLIAVGLLAVQSIWTTSLSMFNVILAMLDLYLFSIANILGVPSFVIGAITSIIIISLLALTYRWVKG